VHHSRRLALYHYWVAFAVFLPAVVLGAWQMLMRSPLPAPLDDTAAYYASVTPYTAPRWPTWSPHSSPWVSAMPWRRQALAVRSAA